jgi:hypothetical protein
MMFLLHFFIDPRLVSHYKNRAGEAVRVRVAETLTSANTAKWHKNYAARLF